jgi:neutral ceramidase
MLTAAKSFCLLVAMVALPCSAADTWKAGTAKEKITPDGPMWMAGYGSRNHPATGLINDLWARALVLEDPGGARVVIVALDLVGIGPEIADPILAQLGTKHGLAPAHVALCCSHTHSGPAVGRNLHVMHYDLLDDDQKRRADEYAAALQTKIVELVGRSIAQLRPVKLSFGQGTATFAVNRRNNKEPDVPQLRAEGKLVGPFDHDVPVLKVTDEAGKLTALLFGYACHATVLGDYDWSSDYPGFAASELEQRHPECTAVFFAGCGADQNPLPRRQVELAKKYGKDLADSVDAALGQSLQPLDGKLNVQATRIDLDFAKIPSREEVDQDAQSKDRFIASRARNYQALLDAGKAIPATYSYPIQVWQLGDKLTFITLGGEVVVDYALRLKSKYGAGRTWVAGYSNDVMAYIPSRRVLAEGGYEGGGAMVYYGLPSPWAPSVEESIIDAVARLMQASTQAK